jgi:membrane associated rhomboid family serine protease
MEPVTPIDPRDEARARGAEYARFHASLATRRAPATPVLLAVMVGLFALQSYWGDSASIATSVRMGAVAPGEAYGQPWRLLAYALLHVNLQHLLANGVSLLSLGTFYERLLGTGRFLVVFTLAALGGGVAARLVGAQSVMVGASGAIWGLLGVSSALALRPGDTLPAEVQANFRRSTATNMAIQVFVSFLPGVSWQAHFGGGIVGFALMLTGLVRPSEARRALWGVAGGIGALALAGAMAAALVVGRPWELGEPPALHAEALVGTTLTLDLPARPRVEGSGDAREYVAGDALVDGFMVSVRVAPHTFPATAEQLPGLAAETLAGLSSVALGEGMTADGAARSERLADGTPMVARDFGMANHTRLERRIAVRRGELVIVDVARRRDDARTLELAQRILASVRDGAPR